METATFGAGCYWCVETIFQRLEGVQSVVSGFSGGRDNYVTYKEVCSGQTGHAEVCQIVFDPAKITYNELLDVFFQIHDPTTLNRQGDDMGSQYRSVVFHHSEEQRRAAEQKKSEMDATGTWKHSIVTEISAFVELIPADENHQDYYNKNPEERYCRLVIQPKLKKLQTLFKTKLSEPRK